MPSLDWDIEIEPGSDWEYDIYLVEKGTKDPADLSFYNFEHRFYSQKGGTSIHTTNPYVDPAAGLIHLWVPASVSEEWTWKRGYHELIATTAGPLEELRILDGSIRLI